MLLTIGKFRRAYLYRRLLGERNVKRVMRGGVQIWPDESDRVRKLVVEIPAATEENYAFLRHMDAGLEDGLDEASRWAKTEVDGRTWYLKKAKVVNYNLKYSLATWDMRGEIDFGDDGPYQQSVHVGDYIYVTIRMPDRVIKYPQISTITTVNNEIDLPGLQGYTLHIATTKWARSTNMCYEADMYSMPSGEKICHMEGHNRSKHKDYKNDYGSCRWRPGETSLKLVIANKEGPSGIDSDVTFYGFSLRMKLKVLDVIVNG